MSSGGIFAVVEEKRVCSLDPVKWQVGPADLESQFLT